MVFVVDFEFTTECEYQKFSEREIIDIGAVAVSKEFEVLNTFNSLAKNKFTKLSNYCTKITGITEESISCAKYFNETLKELIIWCENLNHVTNVDNIPENSSSPNIKNVSLKNNGLTNKDRCLVKESEWDSSTIYFIVFGDQDEKVFRNTLTLNNLNDIQEKFKFINIAPLLQMQLGLRVPVTLDTLAKICCINFTHTGKAVADAEVLTKICANLMSENRRLNTVVLRRTRAENIQKQRNRLQFLSRKKDQALRSKELGKLKSFSNEINHINAIDEIIRINETA